MSQTTASNGVLKCWSRLHTCLLWAIMSAISFKTYHSVFKNHLKMKPKRRYKTHDVLNSSDRYWLVCMSAERTGLSYKFSRRNTSVLLARHKHRSNNNSCPTTASAANPPTPRELSRSGLGSLGGSLSVGGSSDVRDALVTIHRSLNTDLHYRSTPRRTGIDKALIPIYLKQTSI